VSDKPLRQRFALAIGATSLIAEGRNPRGLGGWDHEGLARARTEDYLERDGKGYLAERGITSRDELIAWIRPRLHGTSGDERAYELAQIVAVVGTAVWAKLMSDDDAWHVILVAARLAQQAFSSWDEFAASYLRGHGAPQDLETARALWAELPWTTDLEVSLVDPATQPRVLAASCPGCGAPRTRPSPSAYVYCDFCGQLMDYDLAVAMANPMQQPGPVYVQLHAQLAPALSAAREGGQRETYRALQRQLFAAWVDACPTAVPVRIKEPAYREAYAAWLAEAQVVADFDADARDKEGAMHQAVAQLQFIRAGAVVRVPGERFSALADAMFAYESRRDELCVEHGVYALHPDGASRELQRRIGWSMFAQGWLPMLEPDVAQTLLARTNLAREYRALAPAATRATSCTHCGGPLQVVEGARRVVCEHCGRLADVLA
jgi:hypothetical protein